MAPPLSWLLMVTLVCTTLLSGRAEEDREVYVVYMGDLPKSSFISVSSFHNNILQEVLGSTDASKYLLHSYKRSFNGFVAKLTKEEMKRVSGMEGIVSVFPSKKLQLQTTRSWDFMGFPLKAQRKTTESNIVIGIMDTGIWPEAESFSDVGFGPPPSKWKGTCKKSANFTCNNKIIGARYYRSDENFPIGEFESPRDSEGHGTHTASIAAGGVVDDVSFLDVAGGTARGGVPSARISVYKICWSDGCSDADMLAAFDDAIADGVDIISISVGAEYFQDYEEDPIAIGAYHAMKNGIFTSVAAGNQGPRKGFITNFAPWFLSVAASTIDRNLLTKLVLGNHETYEDPISVNSLDMKDMHPIIYAGDAPNKTAGVTGSTSRLCTSDSLDKSLVAGKIVLCDRPSGGQAAMAAKAAGSIFPGDGTKDATFPFPLPTFVIDPSDFGNIRRYINSTRKPSAKIKKTITVEDETAPIVASFSSRGPNPIQYDILSPDITAPGYKILAAWTEASSLTGVPGDNRVFKYNILSGTSMACPHAAAAAAYVKSFHPKWSPSAIKSALLTTATPMNVKTNPDMEASYGSGHLNPVNAIHPGLVYDIGEKDYLSFLCGNRYVGSFLKPITNAKCTKFTTVWDLNVPSFTVSTFEWGANITRTFTRTVTNVGSAVSTYKAKVTTSANLTVKVEPTVLRFKSLGEKKSFNVTVTTNYDNLPLSGSLVWDDGVYRVRSPIYAYTN